jgi:CPA1 family monovalent cation:H+ antiporter
LSSGEATLSLIRLFVLLLGASAIVTILAKRIKLPYTVGLVAFGLAAGAFAPLQFEITPQLVLVVLLPALIFEASYRTDLIRLRSSLPGVALLAGPGVFVSAAIVAAALNLGAGLPWPEAFVVGAMLSATDPAAVIATFRRLRSPARLSTLVEGESVFNDGTGIVVFSLAVDFVSRPVGPLEVTADFVSVVVLSTALGAATGYLASRILPHVGDHLIEISLSVVLAYGTYLVADAFHQSGVIATAVSGITLGNYGRRHGLSEVTEEALTTVWDFVAYLATAFVFLVVGFAIAARSLVNVADAIAWATMAALVSRAVIVYLIFGAWRWTRQRADALVAARRSRSARRAQRSSEAAAADGEAPVEELPPSVAVESPRVVFPTPWLHVVFWSGLRGAVSTALALSLPVDFPDRAQLQGITFGVVLFTLVVQATTAEWVVSRWGTPVEAIRANTEGPEAPSAA